MLDHVAIVVSDISDSIKWYCNKFSEAEVIHQDDTWGMINIDGLHLAMVLEDMHPPHIAISLPGKAPEGVGKHRDGSKYIYEKDPDGNVIETIWWEK
jgi:catechol 2,3-dioxygenase-like lactoylglutathione lyase family enzyme